MLVVIRKLAWAVLVACSPATVSAQATLTVDGTEFVLATLDGRVLRSADLAGATLVVGSGAGATRVTIGSVEEDSHAVGGRVLLHRLTAEEAGGPVELCAPDAQGRRLGFPVPDGRGGFDLTCTSGAVGKCIRWGYRPWEQRLGGPPMADLHRACIHMARADYGGEGVPTTRDGTLIDLFDRFSIQRPDRKVGMSFEAAWGVEGAVCVAHVRIAENVTLEEIAQLYPRLRSHLGPERCTEDGSRQDPRALLFNRSRE